MDEGDRLRSRGKVLRENGQKMLALSEMSAGQIPPWAETAANISDEKGATEKGKWVLLESNMDTNTEK